jgi:glycosyltransferase involved in cell wall biosynthesis
MPLARAARAAGFRVYVATRTKDHVRELEEEGLQVLALDWRRESLNPLRAFVEIYRIAKIYRSYRPDLVHHIALKPSLYGSIAALFSLRSPVINNLAGLGQGFSGDGVIAGLIRRVLSGAVRWLFRRKESCTIVENSDDRDFLIEQIGVPANSVVLIRGIGVDERRFCFSEEPPVPVGQAINITMVSRLLWPKGVGELIEAGRLLRKRGNLVTIQLIGKPDESSRLSVPETKLDEWVAEGSAEWLGHRDDIPQIWRQAHIAVLPSYYREGIPRSLLEAAACGRPVVTSDMPGCREVVEHGVSGFLVPPHNVDALAQALESLVRDPDLRRRMGLKGRELIERDLTEQHVVEQTMATYQKILDKRDKGY